ncbi:MAG: FAA hydrolase family protein [Rubrivivax sp.]|nr:MAG: FAA hydrolase family protein [Rubrivivax sp.]
MSNFVFPPAEIPSAAVRGTNARYAVSRIFCVGRNFADHAREMGHDPTREPPFYFTKPASAMVSSVAPSGATVPYPTQTQNYHYEMELVIAIGAPVFKVTPEAARAAIWGYATGLDMTRRDLQAAAKAGGKPWDTAKGFDQSAILGEIVRVSEVGLLDKGAITLAVNGVEKQRGDLADMIWNQAEIVSNLSHLYRLHPGDLIYTGTPAGVGAVVTGDVITGRIEGLGDIQLTIGPAE